MKAITEQQPRATLIAHGIYHVVSRTHRAPAGLIGQTIAIHAGKHRPKDVWCSFMNDPVFPPELAPLYDYGKCVDPQESNDGEWWRYRWGGPLGAVVATATLADCLPMVEMNGDDERDGTCVVLNGTKAHIDHEGEFRLTDIADQLPYGDFQPGRWAWMLTDVRPTTERCPACGGTGGEGWVGDARSGAPWTPCGYCWPRIADGELRMGYPTYEFIRRNEARAFGCPPILATGKPGLWEWMP